MKKIRTDRTGLSNWMKIAIIVAIIVIIAVAYPNWFTGNGGTGGGGYSLLRNSAILLL